LINFFPLWKRIILWDNFPTNDYKPHLRFIHAYQGREPGIENHIDGILANPMEQFNASLIPLSTVFDFINCPSEYNPEKSLLSVLETILKDKQLANDMKFLIDCAPASTLFIRPPVDFTSSKTFYDIRTTITKIKNSPNVSDELKRELNVFFEILEKFGEMNEIQLLLEQIAQTSVETDKSQIASKFEAYKKQLSQAQRDLEILLNPGANDAAIAEERNRLNTIFCSPK